MGSCGLLGIRPDRGFEFHFDELSAEHVRERTIEDNILLLGKLGIKGALN